MLWVLNRSTYVFTEERKTSVFFQSKKGPYLELCCLVNTVNAFFFLFFFFF